MKRRVELRVVIEADVIGSQEYAEGFLLGLLEAAIRRCPGYRLLACDPVKEKEKGYWEREVEGNG